MNHLTKQKIALYLAVIFVAGGISGAVIAWGSANQARKGRPTMTMEGVCDSMKKRLQRELNLTEDQVKKIQPILDQTAREMNAIHRKGLDDIGQVIKKSNAEIAKELTPEQQAKWAEMEKQKREHFQKERRENHPKRIRGARPPC